jgi:hypothetical protein
MKHRWNNQVLFIRKMAMQQGEEKIGIGGVGISFASRRVRSLTN